MAEIKQIKGNEITTDLRVLALSGFAVDRSKRPPNVNIRKTFDKIAWVIVTISKILMLSFKCKEELKMPVFMNLKTLQILYGDIFNQILSLACSKPKTVSCM